MSGSDIICSILSHGLQLSRHLGADMKKWICISSPFDLSANKTLKNKNLQKGYPLPYKEVFRGGQNPIQLHWIVVVFSRSQDFLDFLFEPQQILFQSLYLNSYTHTLENTPDGA
jgi:hypothetical protein